MDYCLAVNRDGQEWVLCDSSVPVCNWLRLCPVTFKTVAEADNFMLGNRHGLAVLASLLDPNTPAIKVIKLPKGIPATTFVVSQEITLLILTETICFFALKAHPSIDRYKAISLMEYHSQRHEDDRWLHI